MVREIEIENLVTLISAFFTIVVLVLSYKFEEVQALLLTILTILLPLTYQIGYNIAKDIIKTKENKTQKELYNYLIKGNKENELLKHELKKSNEEIEKLIKNKKNSDKLIKELEKSLDSIFEEKRKQDKLEAEISGQVWDEDAQMYI